MTERIVPKPPGLHDVSGSQTPCLQVAEPHIEVRKTIDVLESRGQYGTEHQCVYYGKSWFRNSQIGKEYQKAESDKEKHQSDLRNLQYRDGS